MNEFVLSAFADEYDRDPDAQIAFLKSEGVPFIEPRFVGEKNIADLDDEEAHALREKLDAAGIRVYSVGSPVGKIPLEAEEKHLAIAERVFRTAKILGATRVRIFSFYLPEGADRREAFPRVCALMKKTLDLADRYGLVLCHENEAGIFGNSPENCLSLLRAFGGRLRAVFDGGNFVLGGYDPLAAYETLKDYVDYFHIKDALRSGAVVPPGKGDAALRETFRRFYAERGEGTVLTLEPHLAAFDGLSALGKADFATPYVFSSQQEAFLTALHNTKEML